MPYTTVVPSTTITSAWGNANVRDQVVTPFATAAARTSAVAAPVAGMLSFRSDSAWWDGYDGTNWQYMPRIIGGNKWTGGGNHVVGLAATELSIFATPTIALPPNTVCRVSVSFKVLGNTNGDTWLFNLRDTSVAGLVRGDYTWTVPNSIFGYKIQFEAVYETTVAENKIFCLCAGRIGGTGVLTITAGGVAAPTYLMATAAGPAGSLTTQATP